jgi:hypothetical protein
LFPQARKSQNGAYRVSPATLGRTCEEDLSIKSDGIKDFGVHDMGDPRAGRRTPIDLVIEHGSAPHAGDAARWLAERLGTEFDPASGEHPAAEFIAEQRARFEARQKPGNEAAGKAGDQEQTKGKQQEAGNAVWPEPVNILADACLTGVAQVDETCLPISLFDS